MKTFYLLFILLSTPAESQNSLVWGKVDTITAGDAEDLHPVMPHNDGGYRSREANWLVFEHRTPTESMIAGKRVNAENGRWDTTAIVISSLPIEAQQSFPDISGGEDYMSDSTGGTFHPISLAGWQQKVDDHWNISCAWMNDSSWSEPFFLTHDSVSTVDVHIRYWSGSTFLVTWVQGNALVYSIVHPGGSSIPDTISVSASPNMEYDLARGYDRAIAVWTTIDSAGKSIMVLRETSGYSQLVWMSPETLSVMMSAFHPHLVFPAWTDAMVLFEADNLGKRDIFLWRKYYNQAAENLSQNPEADDINARAYVTPFIVKAGTLQYSPFDAFAMEQHMEGDSTLIFGGYFDSDTVRTPGHNRDICFGSTLVYSSHNNLSYISSVWESNRTGVAHIYGRLIYIPWLEVKPPKTQPAAYTLHPNFPNPFNPKTTLLYDLPENAHVTLAVYDILGREVAVLVDGVESAGNHAVRWDGSAFSTGMYIARLTSRDEMGHMKENATVKLLLLR